MPLKKDFTAIPVVLIIAILSLLVFVSCDEIIEQLYTTNVSDEPSDGETARLIADLRAADTTVSPSGEITQPFFTVKGQVITVNGGDVQVFEYVTVEAADAEAAQVSPDGTSIGTSIVLWVATPHFYKRGQVIVLYVGDDADVINPLKAVLGEQFAGG